MNYITTFDTTFAVLCALQMISLALGFLFQRWIVACSSLDHVMKTVKRVQKISIAAGVVWIGILAVAAYTSLAGLTTFLFGCVILGLTLATVGYTVVGIYHRRKLHMVDIM